MWTHPTTLYVKVVCERPLNILTLQFSKNDWVFKDNIQQQIILSNWVFVGPEDLCFTFAFLLISKWVGRDIFGWESISFPCTLNFPLLVAYNLDFLLLIFCCMYIVLILIAFVIIFSYRIIFSIHTNFPLEGLYRKIGAYWKFDYIGKLVRIEFLIENFNTNWFSYRVTL